MFKLNLVTPDQRLIVDQELDEITLPAFSGELNLLPGHSPLMTTLDSGLLSYRLKNGESAKFAISWGYCQVSSDGVSVLAENAISPSNIDTKVVKEHLETNEARLATEALSDQDYEKIQKEIVRLSTELEIAGYNKH